LVRSNLRGGKEDNVFAIPPLENENILINVLYEEKNSFVLI